MPLTDCYLFTSDPAIEQAPLFTDIQVNRHESVKSNYQVTSRELYSKTPVGVHESSNTINIQKKKRVTAGEVDKLRKELGNCTH